MLLVIGALGTSFGFLVHAQENFETAQRLRQRSIVLADELRQSSNDLTRLVRTYVITGKPVFKEQFYEVFDIRDGRRPRPMDYSPSYWDFRAVRPDQQRAEGEKVPLLELTRRAGFTETELSKLAQAKINSDALTVVEIRAINLVEEAAHTHDHQARETAIQLVFGDAFHEAKARIMAPLAEFDQMVDSRTQRDVEAAHSRIVLTSWIIGGLSLLLMAMLGLLHQQLQRIVGCSVPELERVITQFSTGDFRTPIRVSGRQEDSVLGWMAWAQHRLAQLDLHQFKSIVDSSDDAIISKTPSGVITSWNRSAEVIFGYTPSEAIGQPMTMLMPADRMHEEHEILERIAHGERVEHFQTQRRHKQGHLVDVSVTISPMYDQDGKLIGASKIARDITQAKRAEAEIIRLAHYDTLTDLPNRRLFMDRLQQAVARIQRTSGQFAVMFIDLDRFKQVNDTLGHDAGDDLLRQVAARLKECVRQSDTVSRFGGDEFVVLLHGQDGTRPHQTEWVSTVAEKMIRHMARPFYLAGTELRVSASVGAAVCADDRCTVKEIMKSADEAMYRAKASGRNNFCLFEPQKVTEDLVPVR